MKKRRAAVRGTPTCGVLFGPAFIAGLRIPDEDVRELAELVDEPTRSFFEKSLALDTGVVALAIEDRERIRRCPD